MTMAILVNANGTQNSIRVRWVLQFMTTSRLPFTIEQWLLFDISNRATTTTADRKITVKGVELTATDVTVSSGEPLVQWHDNISVLPDMTLSSLSAQGPRDDVTIELKALAYVAKLPRLTWFSKSRSHSSIRQTVAALHYRHVVATTVAPRTWRKLPVSPWLAGVFWFDVHFCFHRPSQAPQFSPLDAAFTVLKK